jgi:hypothetical protein
MPNRDGLTLEVHCFNESEKYPFQSFCVSLPLNACVDWEELDGSFQTVSILRF